MIIDTTNDELLINGQRWQRGGYLQATAYATDQINITARDGRVIGKALQWDAIYDQDKNLFGLNRDGVVTALTTVFNSRVKSPYNLEALRDVQDGTASYGDILIWSAPGEWQYDTLTQYHHAYNSEAATLRAGATATTELYYTAQADGDGLSESAQSNTPAEGYQIVRKLYYAEAAQADPDTGTWVQFAALDPNTTYASAKATLLAYLKERTGGTVPISLKMTWEEVEEFDGLLDTYGGAAAAYSVRRLSSSYEGSLIQVERASDNTTQDIGYDSNGDLDTAAIATFCSGTTCGVRVWYDQSGSGNDATQTTFANQPTIYTGGAVVTENGKPILQTNAGAHLTGTADGSMKVFGVGKVSRTSMFLDYGGDAQGWLLVAEDGSTADYKHSTVNVDAMNLNAVSYAYASADRNLIYDAFSIHHLLYVSYTTTKVNLGLGYMATPNTFPMWNQQEVIAYPSTSTHSVSAIETNVNDYFGIYTPFTTGLLDDYGGAAAAYSLRRLSSTYTGSAIRVRRASDNAEQDIGFDIEGNLNTAALASFCSGTDGFVKTWYDQANSNDATQTTTANQPKIYDSATGVVTDNGKPAVQGSSACIMSIASSIIGVGDYSVYTAHTYSEADMLYGGTSPVFGIWDINGDILQRFDDGTNALLTASYVNGDRILSYQNRASGAWEIAANGGTPATGTNTASLTIDRLFTGFGSTTYSFAGKVQEFIFYESDQSANRTGIESNINTFYSIY